MEDIRYPETPPRMASVQVHPPGAARNTAMILCSTTLMVILGCAQQRVAPPATLAAGTPAPEAQPSLPVSATVQPGMSITAEPTSATSPMWFAAAPPITERQHLSAAAPVAAAALPSARASELIMAGDLLQVEVEGEEKYSGQMRVSALGAPFYNLGVIAAVAGMGTGQLAEDLARRYRERDLRDPRVTISIREYAPRRVYLMGHVLRPGVISVNAGGTTTVLRAIAEAGGFTENANRQAISLLREGSPPQMLSEAGILLDPTLDVLLKPDDQLLIPMIDRIYISGEVEHSGPLVAPSGEVLTVSRALSMAGGLGRYASRRILVLRKSASIDIDLDEVLAGKDADPVLQPGDTVFVPQRRF